MNQNIKHLFVINPKSFWKKTKQNQVVAKIHQFFREKKDENYEIYVSQFPRDAVGFIPLYAKKLPATVTLRVYAVGGDGILFDCLNGIMRIQHDVELAAIPYGNTNNFVQSFEKNDRALFRRLAHQYNATTVAMDVMRCGSNYALNYCLVGMEAEAMRRAEKTRENLRKSHALHRWLCKVLYQQLFFFHGIAVCSNKNLMYQKYEVDFDEEKVSGAYHGFSILNGPYYGGSFRPISSAASNDGILDALATRSMGLLKTLFLSPFYKSGHYKISRNFVMKQGKNIHIRSQDILRICMDGIVFYEPELKIELLPAAVKFVDVSKYGYKRWRV